MLAVFTQGANKTLLCDTAKVGDIHDRVQYSPNRTKHPSTATIEHLGTVAAKHLTAMLSTLSLIPAP